MNERERVRAREDVVLRKYPRRGRTAITRALRCLGERARLLSPRPPRFPFTRVIHKVSSPLARSKVSWVSRLGKEKKRDRERGWRRKDAESSSSSNPAREMLRQTGSSRAKDVERRYESSRERALSSFPLGASSSKFSSDVVVATTRRVSRGDACLR